ncbi:MAG: hypothetical protein ABJA80_15505 [bacterium]
MSFNSRRVAFACVAAFAMSGCGSADVTAIEERPTDGLRLLTVSISAPPLATTVASFYAVRGRNAGVDLWYRATPGRSDSTKFLEFRLDGASLDRRPDGTPIADGDSVRITLTVTDATHLIVDFQPSGLRFATRNPARLKMFFTEVGDDLDHNGRVDAEDDAIAQQLSIWRQETLGAPWFKVSSVVVKDNKELDADLAGFTGYAAAY